MSGSGASNLGYGNLNPYIMAKGGVVNATSTNNPANFGSNEIPGLPGLAGDKSNIAAAAGKIPPGICLLKGGAKKLKKKINNITKKYKMKSAKTRRIKSKLNRLRSRYSFLAGKKRNRKSRHRRSSKAYQRGGYSQYMNNLPLTRSYSLGGNLSPSDSALANPPLLKLNTIGGCIDNYNHFTNMGFPSKGH
jgi:hypothetical protein